MLRTLRDLATGRSWRARLSRGARRARAGRPVDGPDLRACCRRWRSTTPASSVPEGLYLYPHRIGRRPPERGDTVAVRDPPHFDLPWLLKRVAGLPGDRYCWNSEAGTHELNGRPMPPPDPDATGSGSRSGRAARRWRRTRRCSTGARPTATTAATWGRSAPATCGASTARSGSAPDRTTRRGAPSRDGGAHDLLLGVPVSLAVSFTEAIVPGGSWNFLATIGSPREVGSGNGRRSKSAPSSSSRSAASMTAER